MKKLFVIVFASTLLVSNIKSEEKMSYDISKHIEIYNSVLKELQLNYVDSLDYETMLQFSLDNMLYTLDPYTVFIPEQQEESIRRMRSGEYGGIGSVVTQLDGEVYIFSPYKGMPAEKAGVKAGDKILTVDGKSTDGMTVSQVSDMLRGVPGTKITLKLLREGESKAIVKKFDREIVNIDPIPYFGMLDEEVAYIVFNDFIDISYLELKDIMNTLVTMRGAKKVIIDLRNNGGGLIDQSVKIASLFVPRGSEIVSVKGNIEQSEEVHKTKTEPLYPDMPVAFLVGENTASAAEILSGAMQDLDRAVVFGKRTYGKGLVQGIRRLPYNSYIKLTTAKYYLPSGRCIQAIDYDDRKNYGRDRNIPDSLTTEFFSKNGRSFRDASGITPDVEIEREIGDLNISYYLLVENLYFKYANQYVLNHVAIASPKDFSLTDEEFDDFVKFVVDSKFTYRLESERYLSDLYELVRYEGLDVISDSLFMELKAVLKPNVERDIKLFKEDVKEILEKEIVKRYYYHWGELEYSIKSDDELQKLMEYMNNGKAKWDEILLPSKGE